MDLRLLSGHRSGTLPSRAARLEGVLGSSTDKIVTVGGRIVVWPAEIMLSMGPRFELLDRDSTVSVALEGQTVRLRGGSAPPPDGERRDLGPVFWASGPVRVVDSDDH